MHLLTSQRTRVFDYLSESGFSPAQFDFQHAASTDGQITRLSLKSSEFYFDFGGDGDRRFIRMSPGESSVFHKQGCTSFQDQMIYLMFWLRYVKRELSTPDKWAELLSAGSAIAWERLDEANTQFTFGEVLAIQDAAKHAKARMSDLKLNSDQLTDHRET